MHSSYHTILYNIFFLGEKHDSSQKSTVNATILANVNPAYGESVNTDKAQNVYELCNN